MARSAPSLHQMPRRPYRTAEKLYIKQHYPDTPAAQLATALDRPLGSLYQFIKRHPELQKRPRIS
jgi:hypothetical protein